MKPQSAIKTASPERRESRSISEMEELIDAQLLQDDPHNTAWIDAMAAEKNIVYSDATGVKLLNKYPIELLAPIAAQLLKDDDFKGAAVRAARLLGACESQNSHILRKKKHLDDLTSVRGELPEHVPFDKAICEITGQKRADRALASFRKFLEVWSGEFVKLPPIQFFCESGFHWSNVAKWRKMFLLIRDMGVLKIRRAPKKSQKKVLTADEGGSLPRSGKSLPRSGAKRPKRAK